MEDDRNKQREESNYEMNQRRKKKKPKYRVKEDFSTGKKGLAGEGSRRKDGGEK